MFSRFCAATSEVCQVARSLTAADVLFYDGHAAHVDADQSM